MQIAGSVLLVTGAASGLGAACARMIVANGGKVILADISDAAGTALAAELGAATRFVRTDVADEASAKTAIAAGLAAFGAIHGRGELEQCRPPAGDATEPREPVAGTGPL